MAGRAPWQDGRRAWERLNGWHIRRALPLDNPVVGENALGALEEVRLIRGLLDMAELNAARAARQYGYGWVEIATRLGISPEAAQEKWGDDDERR